MEALIMRLTSQGQPIALHDIKQCSEPSFSFQMAGGSAGICPDFFTPRNGFPKL